MSFRKNLCTASVVALSLVAGSAHAVLFTSSGEWISVEELNGGVDDVSGLNSNEIRWGVPFPSGATTPQSGYIFDGIAGDAPTDNSLFALGDFTHVNFPIFLPSITGATLDVELSFTPGPTKNFSLAFEHNETPNEGTCNPAGSTVCPDVVSIPDASSEETVMIGLDEYLLVIVGFSEDGGDNITDGFITEEGQNNTATLFARLELVPPTEVPLPNALALLGMGLLAFGVRRNRRRA